MQKRWLYAGLLLLALPCLPTSARANSVGDTYTPEISTIESRPVESTPKTTAPPKGHPDPKPKTGEEAPAETTTAPEGEAESQERHQNQTVAPGGGHPPKGGGDPPQRATPKLTDSSGQARPRPREGTSTPVEGAEGGGGSSPVLPILIAVAVLAALSIGTVIYRGRTPQAS